MMWPTDPTTGREYDEDDWDNDAREFRTHSKRVDHAAVIRDYIRIYPDGNYDDETMVAVDSLESERDALAADLARVVAYARTVELKWWNEVNDRANGHPDTHNLIEDLRAEHGVAALMDADR